MHTWLERDVSPPSFLVAKSLTERKLRFHAPFPLICLTWSDQVTSVQTLRSHGRDFISSLVKADVQNHFPQGKKNHPCHPSRFLLSLWSLGGRETPFAAASWGPISRDRQPAYPASRCRNKRSPPRRQDSSKRGRNGKGGKEDFPTTLKMIL